VDMAEIKSQSRRVIHDRAAVSAIYTGPKGSGVIGAPTVRWHNKIVRPGAQPDGYDVTIIEGINRLIFNISQLATAGLGGVPLVLARTGEVAVESLNATFVLDALEPGDGPESIYWAVSRKCP
jgi:hypothetical protein